MRIVPGRLGRVMLPAKLRWGMVLRISIWSFSAVGFVGAAALAFSLFALVTARGQTDTAGAAAAACVTRARTTRRSLAAVECFEVAGTR